jgi:branched-chain amino acid transport system ATP-binding protein
MGEAVLEIAAGSVDRRHAGTLVEPVLCTKNLRVAFGGVCAIDDLTISVRDREARGIIGPNGAGKTTLFNALTGIVQPSHGDIRLLGRSIHGHRPRQIVRRGLVRTFQITSIFPSLTVRENVALSAQFHYGVLPPILLRSRRKDIAADVDQIIETLDLDSLAEQPAGLLSYGDQRVVELAIAMASRPKLLLLDEPTAGMSPAETSRITQLVKRLKERLTVVIIEHDMEVVRGIADLVTVLHFGRLVAEGTFDEVHANLEVRQIYFGANVC